MSKRKKNPSVISEIIDTPISTNYVHVDESSFMSMEEIEKNKICKETYARIMNSKKDYLELLGTEVVTENHKITSIMERLEPARVEFMKTWDLVNGNSTIESLKGYTEFDDPVKYDVGVDPYADIDEHKVNTPNFPVTTRDIMSTTKITPADIPTFYTEAVAIATSFKTNVGTVPTSWGSAMMKIGGIFKFLTESYPHIMKIVEAIKD